MFDDYSHAEDDTPICLSFFLRATWMKKKKHDKVKLFFFHREVMFFCDKQKGSKGYYVGIN